MKPQEAYRARCISCPWHVLPGWDVGLGGRGGGGYPCPVLSWTGGGGAFSCPGQGGGAPVLILDWGTLSPPQVRVREHTSPEGPGTRPKVHLQLWEMTWDQRPMVRVPLSYGQTHTCENSTFPILRMRAVKRMKHNFACVLALPSFKVAISCQ